MVVKLKKKSAKPAPKAEVSEESQSPAAPVVEATPTPDPETVVDQAVAAAPVEAAPAAAPEAPAAAPTVSAAVKENYVRVVMLREIDPAPKMGDLDVGALLGVKRLAEGAEYSVPYEVGCRLKDAKAVMLFGN